MSAPDASRVRARARCVTLFLLGVVFMVGCSPSWSVPNDDPLWVRVEEGGTVSFRWCGETTREYGYLLIRLESARSVSPERVAYTATGPFALRHDEEFDTVHPPLGAEYEPSESPLSQELPGAVFVYTGDSEDNRNGLRVIFDLERADPRPAGDGWLSPGGRWRPEPCESIPTE